MKVFLLLLALASGLVQVYAAEIKVVLFPFREAVISSRVDSIVKPYKFKIGESFKKDCLIGELDNSKYLLEAKRAKAQFAFAKSAFEDKKALRENNFTSDFELNKAQFDMQMAESALSEAELNLSFCALKAPFTGKIVEILTREYETCRPGQNLLRIIDDSRLLATANVPADKKSLTTPGNQLVIKLNNNITVKGQVFEVSPQADHRTGTVRIRILVENASGKLTGGTTGVLQDVK